MKKRPLQQAEFIRKEFSKYIKSTFILKNEIYNNSFQEQLDNSILTKGPFLKLELPFYKGRTLNQMIYNNEISSLFKNFIELNLDRTLYWHQEEALKLIIEGENVVVTTGTGSGKTEAFLYPILNELLKKIDENGSLEGIQALLLYPMNALVNDQLERLRKILKDYPEITFGYFTGDTKENYEKWGTRDHFINDHFSESDIKPPINEALTRDEIRKKAPNILITNYSMLEYLLIRPKDKEIFNIKTLKDWSFMVLDEAHTYRGTLATEISHLLKRLQHYSGKKPQFILTSATLGSKDEDKANIVRFASNLTGVKFSEKGVVFAKRIPFATYKTKYGLKPEEYQMLLDRENNQDNYFKILEKYEAHNLFELLKSDINIHFLSFVLKETKTFKEAFEKFTSELPNFSIIDFENIIDLVTDKDVIDENKTGLCDIKYHQFIRTLEGAFVSLKPHQKLQITNREYIDDMWAFEIGSCQFCNTMYILGKEYNNKIFRTDLDLEENYMFFDDLQIDFYLVKEEVIDEIEDLEKNFIEVIVCSKCGQTSELREKEALTCKCGEKYRVALLKVKQDDKSDIKNNLTECKVCQRNSIKRGIINSFRIGKDQATALISQMLLQSMDSNKEIIVEKKTKSLFEEPKIIVQEDSMKQFLAFSDSRQQASFYALFFQENLDRFLRKALVLKHCHHKNISLIINEIEIEIENKQLFIDERSKKLGMKAQNHAAVAVLFELLKADGVNSLEGLGLLSFRPSLKKILDSVSENELKKYLPKVEKEQLDDLLCVVLDIFRTAPAINYNLLNSEQAKEYLNYRSFRNKVKLKKMPNSKEVNVRSLLPILTNASNKLTDYFVRAFDLALDEAINYINAIWTLLINGEIIQKAEKNGEYYIDYQQYDVLKKEETNWYICGKCKTLTTHNINNTCLKKNCYGKISECNPDEEFANNYYREQYLKKQIEKIAVEEHTGQIERQDASELQKKFKNKELNILSSSTTFEMGVDIGALSTVFMRNIPPTNANYSQRAGRAGRSKDSVAFVVTYVNSNSHDQMYFQDPTPMINGIVSPPIFKLNNKKITIRHILAFLLGKFYRDNNYDDSVEFFLEFGHESLIKYLQTKKVKLEEEIKFILNDEVKSSFIDYKWFDELTGEKSLIHQFINKIIGDLDKLLYAKKVLNEEGKYYEVGNVDREIKNLKSKNIVETFAQYHIIPTYGFPINVVPLKIFDKVNRKFNQGINVERELSIAISEYAPDSEIIVKKQKYTSEYIILPKEGDFIYYNFIECENKECNYNEIKINEESEKECPKCGNSLEKTKFIEPIYGFISTGNKKMDNLLKPAKTYNSEIKYLGKIEDYVKNEKNLNIKDFIYIQRETDDKLLVLNENPFFYCQICGKAKLNKKGAKLMYYIDKKPHSNHYGKECDNKKFTKTALGHVVITDVIKIKVNIEMDYVEAYSTLTAIKNGITALLQIDKFDINGTIVKDKNTYAFILYDTTYGGSGNVKQLFEMQILLNVLNLALQSVNNECCSEDVSCSNCLRDYYNRKHHNDLKRGKARDTIKRIINQIQRA